jgi:DNA-binding NarL/FixJ family response regulator
LEETQRHDRYQPVLRATDVAAADRLTPGSGRHCFLLDLIASIESEDEEDIVRLAHHGWSQAEIAIEFGITQQAVSKKLKQIVSRSS